MNLGRQPNGAMSSTVSLINSLDEATRVKVLAELPEELQRRYLAEQHAASFLAAARLNLSADSAQQMLASGFLNLSPPETLVGQTINLLKAPVAGSPHAILKASVTCASHNNGITIAGASQNHSTPMAHHIAARLPTASGISNLDLNHTAVNGFNAHGFIGSHSSGVRISAANLSQGVNARSVGLGLSPSTGSNRISPPGPGTSHSYDPRMNINPIVHNTTVMTTARQLGGASTANMQMGLSPGNSMHLSSPHRFSTLPGSLPPGINGHLVRHKTIISTYLDDFKQGFPTKGLSSVSDRWWGSTESDKTTEMSSGVENPSGGGSETDASELEDAVPGHRRPGLSVTARKGKEANEVLSSWRRVTRSRRRAALSGKKALHLGVAKGYGVQKLGHKEVAMLEFVFGDSIPRQWFAALPARD